MTNEERTKFLDFCSKAFDKTLYANDEKIQKYFSECLEELKAEKPNTVYVYMDQTTINGIYTSQDDITNAYIKDYGEPLTREEAWEMLQGDYPCAEEVNTNQRWGRDR